MHLPKLRNIFFPLALILVVLVISKTNYVPGTYLSGWDTIHPEFDFPEYFKRIFSVWQEHQGLGAPAAQAHASEIPRLLIYYPFSLILPASFLRYGYFFLTLMVGALGVYFFVKEIGKSQKAAFLSALFYLLNLATLQTYVLPLEMFATHFASLGWLFLFAHKTISDGGRRNLILFYLTVFFTAPIAHTPTLFYVFFGIFAFFLIIFSFLKHKLKKGFLLIVLILAINSFWLLPNIYYVLNFGSTVVDSKISSQFSDRAFQVGKNNGNVADTALLKNFLFEWGEYNNKEGKFSFILDDWSVHLTRSGVAAIGFTAFILALFGLLIAIIKRNIIGISFLPVLIIPFFFICNDNGLFLFFYDNILSKSSIFKEALRFPFTKFSIMLAFSYAIYLAFALDFIFSAFSRLGKKSGGLINFLLVTLAAVALFYFTQPMFEGNLINYKMKANIPNEYFQMFDWFRTQDSSARVAYLPMNTFWGWTYYNWGYEGAGFLWFGLRQPVLNREFDRWMATNEGFYWEASHAIYSQNLALFESVLAKYKVEWLILDANSVDVSSAKSTYLEQFEDLIKGSSKISRAEQFNNIMVFKFQNPTQPQKFISFDNSLPTVAPAYQFSDSDQAYLPLGDYLSKGAEDIYYPFRTLFSNSSSQKPGYQIIENDSEIVLTANVPPEMIDYQLYLPSQTAKPVPWFDASKLEEAGFTIPKVSFDGRNLTIKIPKVKSVFASELDPTKLPTTENINCDYLAYSENRFSGIVENKIISSEHLLEVSSQHASNCSARFILPQLPHHLGYLISVTHKNKTGNSLLFWLENLNARRADLEIFLPQSKTLRTDYLFQPPMEQFGAGYTLHFDNWSFNNDKTVNDLGRVAIYPVQWDFLTNIAFVKPDFALQSANLQSSKVTHQAPFFYTAETGNSYQDQTISLYQSYEDGWVAWLYPGQLPLQNLTHIKVNNWANGWVIPANTKGTVIIFYFPQLLEWGGLLVLVSVFIMLFAKRRRRHHHA